MVREPKLSHAVREWLDVELFAYRATVEAITRRCDQYLSLSGEGDDGTGIVAHRSRILESDPTGNAAARMASDDELQAWRATVRAIESVYDGLPGAWADLMALYWWSRDPDGRVRRPAFVAAELDLDYPGHHEGSMFWRLSLIRGRVACALKLA